MTVQHIIVPAHKHTYDPSLTHKKPFGVRVSPTLADLQKACTLASGPDVQGPAAGWVQTDTRLVPAFDGWKRVENILFLRAELN